MRHYLSPQNIRTDYNGYLEFVRLYHNLKEYENADIIIDFSCVKWFEVNLCAIYGCNRGNIKS